MQKHELKLELDVAWKKVVHYYEELTKLGYEVTLDTPISLEISMEEKARVVATKTVVEVL